MPLLHLLPQLPFLPIAVNDAKIANEQLFLKPMAMVRMVGLQVRALMLTKHLFRRAPSVTSAEVSDADRRDIATTSTARSCTKLLSYQTATVGDVTHCYCTDC